MSVTPFFWQRSNSEAFIGREALAMSGVPPPTPSQNFWMPPPVPSDSTRGAAPPEVREKFSATRLAKGKTVEEPTARTPAWVVGPAALSPQAPRATRAAADTAVRRVRCLGWWLRHRNESRPLGPQVCDGQAVGTV